MHSSKSWPAKGSLLLRLPIELRRAIYSSILPHTSTFDVRFKRSDGELNARFKARLKGSDDDDTEYNHTLVRQPSEAWMIQKTPRRTDREVGNDIVWRRGCTSILATCRQIHDECVDMIYGQNTFVIHVAFDAIKFRQRWRTANNLTPSRSYPFPDHFSQRNLLRIKNYIINVEHVDDYTGMIKYNCGGPGLTAGIRERVRELVDQLSVAPSLVRIHVHLIDGAITHIKLSNGRVHRVQDEENYSKSQSTLDPLHRLCGVRKAEVTGVNAVYANLLVKSMTSTRDVPTDDGVLL